MTKSNVDSDTISEEEYTAQMAAASTAPEDDSPGDSESDAGLEFAIGLNFDPEQQVQGESSESSLSKSTLMDDKTNVSGGVKARTEDDLPETARVVSSDLPEPSLDLGEPSDTH